MDPIVCSGWSGERASPNPSAQRLFSRLSRLLGIAGMARVSQSRRGVWWASVTLPDGGRRTRILGRNTEEASFETDFLAWDVVTRLNDEVL